VPKTNRTDKVDRFVECYLVHLNATQAYKDSHPGVADGTARTHCCMTLRTPAGEDPEVVFARQGSAHTPGKNIVVGETIPHAICLAALRAVGVEI
jgi:hypothetical protein